MIGYIMKSMVCLAIVLVIYLLALEREKMHKFNRGYLLFGLLLSMIIAFLPSGEVIEQVYISSPILFDEMSNVVSSEVIRASITEVDPYAWFTWERFLMVIYSIGLLVMLFKYVKNATQLITKARNRNTISYKGAKLVLLNEKSLPHTFLGNIFVNEDQYGKGEIDEKLLAHEMAHVNQRHTWDVLLVELVKAIFWFNPLLILYKRVMQLNHEFLADEAVIQQYNEVSTYQHLLVDTCQNNNQIYLASNINFLLTKKRLKMMTKQSSRKRIYMLMAGVVPMAILLVMMLGQPVIAQSVSENDPRTKDEYFKKAIIHHKTAEGKVMVKSYSALPDDVKDLLPPPPPTPLGDRETAVMQPLEKGTIVHLGLDGTVRIKSREKGRTQDVTQSNGSLKNELAMNAFMRNDGVRIPYSFSPNGDGNNDVLKAVGPIEDVKSYSLTIYDKNGVIAFKSNDPKETWNGKKGGLKNDPVVGTYIYSLFLVDSNDLEWKKNGEVKLIMDTMPAPPAPPSSPSANGIAPPPPPPAPPTVVGSWKEISDGLNSNIVKYYLDGKETNEQVIENMNADQIERLDVHKEGEGTVIRIVSKKGREKGSNNPSHFKQGDAAPLTQIIHNDSLYTWAEQMPRFPGCNLSNLTSKQKYLCSKENLIQHLNDNLEYQLFDYPALAYPAKYDDTEEIIALQFVVDKNGDLSDIELFGYGDIEDNDLEAAKKVLSDMVRNKGVWTPAKHRGEIVDKVWLVLLRYELPDQEGKN